MNTLINNWKFALALSLTLGLAPFVPEPHIWGKLKWIIGGGDGMTSMDWFDTVLHGTPWIWLIALIIKKSIQKQAN